jgi:hypothetical protein
MIGDRKRQKKFHKSPTKKKKSSDGQESFTVPEFKVLLKNPAATFHGT